jgi:hypothetical protein
MSNPELDAVAASVPREVYMRVEPKGWFGRFFPPGYLNLTQMLYTMPNREIEAIVNQTPGLFLKGQIARAHDEHLRRRMRARRILETVYGSKRRSLPSVWYDAAVFGALVVGVVSSFVV